MSLDSISDFLDIVIDLAILWGEKDLYVGDTRVVNDLILEWAKEFDNKYKLEDWADLDYIETLRDFFEDKLKTRPDIISF